MLIFILLTEIPDCYADVTLQYNENLKTTTISLASMDNPLCEQFQDEIDLVVEFYENWQPIRAILEDFSYRNSSTLVMRNTTIQSTTAVTEALPLFAVLNVSNLAFWTQVRVVSLGKQASQMDRCFSQVGSFFDIKLKNFTFVVTLTEACKKEVSEDAIEFQYQFNDKAGTITIIRETTTSTNHNCQLINTPNTSQIKCWNYGNYLDDIQTPFTAPIIKFFIPSLGVVYSTQIDFETVIIGVVAGIFESAHVKFMIDSFAVFYTITQNETTLSLFTAALGTYDSMLFRLNAKLDTQVITFQFPVDTFDTSRTMLAMSCEDAVCLSNLALLHNNAKAQFYLDLTSFSGAWVNAIAGGAVNQFSACFQRLIVQFRNSEICADLEPLKEWNAECKTLKGAANAKLTSSFVQSGKTILLLQEKVILDDANYEICLACGRECGRGFAESGVVYLLEIVGDSFSFEVTGFQVVWDSYFVVKVVCYGFFGSVVFLCVVDTVIKVVLFQRLMKNVKRGKK